MSLCKEPQTETASFGTYCQQRGGSLRGQEHERRVKAAGVHLRFTTGQLQDLGQLNLPVPQSPHLYKLITMGPIS